MANEQRCESDAEAFRITVMGYEMHITWEPNWLDGDNEFWPSHMVFRCTTDEPTPIPVSNTGYLSYFPRREAVAEAGGAEAYAVAFTKAYALLTKARRKAGDKPTQAQILKQIEPPEPGDQLGLF